MSQAAISPAFDRAFLSARTFNKFSDRTVTDETLRELYDLLKWGPTSMNAQPARFLFLRSEASRARLAPALSAGNLDKTLAAPVTVLVAQDMHFFDHLPQLFPAYDAKPMFEANAALAAETAARNSTLQGAYLIVAARLLGLDAGPMSGFNAAVVDQEFFPDGRWKSNFLINLGYGDASGNRPRGPRLPFETAAQIL
jgi:3-hydroxypropanoate dehydrogenase